MSTIEEGKANDAPTEEDVDETAVADEDINDTSDIEEMIESAVDIDMNKYPSGAIVKKKRVLEHRLTDLFNVLPDGWVEVAHHSGLPVYLHKATRVCTFSRPYSLGSSSVRRHDIPVSSIPCYHMQKRQAEVKAQKEPNVVNKLINAPAVEIMSANDKQHYLDADQIYEYAKNLFKFKTLDVVRFAKWSDTRNYQRQRKRAHGQRINDFDSVDRPGLPAETKLITVPSLNEGAKPSQRALCLNPVGKTSVQLLHDFVQKVLKNSVQYEYEDVQTGSAHFRCVAVLQQVAVSTKIQLHQSLEAKLKILQENYEHQKEGGAAINGEEVRAGRMALGVGFGESKKKAKLAAAQQVLITLVPGLKFNEHHIIIAEDEPKGNDDDQEPRAKAAKNTTEELFDSYKIEDKRIPETCARLSQPQPYNVLREMIRRNSTMTQVEPVFKTTRIRHQHHEFTLTVGSHEITVRGGRAQDSRQQAAQLVLKELYPKAKSWGDMMRLYAVDTLTLQHEARRYKRKITSETIDELSNAFAVSNETIGAELRVAIKAMDERHRQNRHREAVLRPPIGYTAPPLPDDDCAHFGELCARYAPLFPDNELLNLMIE